MKIAYLLPLLWCLIVAAPVYANKQINQEVDDNQQIENPKTNELPGTLEIGLIIGRSELSIEGAYSISGEGYATDAFSFGAELEYRWPNKYIVQTSITSTIDIDIIGIGDNYQLYQWNTLVGYSFELTNNVNLVPKIGFSRWELDASEGALFNSGPELELEFNDLDFTYQIGLEFPIWQQVTMELAYENTRYSFGEVEIVNFGLSFEF